MYKKQTAKAFRILLLFFFFTYSLRVRKHVYTSYSQFILNLKKKSNNIQSDTPHHRVSSVSLSLSYSLAIDIAFVQCLYNIIPREHNNERRLTSYVIIFDYLHSYFFFFSVSCVPFRCAMETSSSLYKLILTRVYQKRIILIIL